MQKVRCGLMIYLFTEKNSNHIFLVTTDMRKKNIIICRCFKTLLNHI